MFSKLRSGSGGGDRDLRPPLDTNPITNHYDVGKQIANAGPEFVWKIYEAYRKSDGKECSVFVFEKRCAEKLHKPKRKETVTEILRNSIKELEIYRHPKLLHVLHSIEECDNTLAFASEPVYASLANIFAFQESVVATSSPGGTQQPPSKPGLLQREYNFLDIEHKYGLLQITEALSFLHFTGHVIHKNVCPASILVTKRGTWKLAGMEFIEKLHDAQDGQEVPCQPWTSRLSKMVQPNLDYMAPECQQQSKCSIMSDMFSLGLIMCAIFNSGRSLIQANYSSSAYSKQFELIEDQLRNILPRVPAGLQECVVRLVNKDVRQRPTAQLLMLLKYFDDPMVQALQYLDTIMMKDPTQKSHFYRNTLKDALPYIPKKLWYQHVWPSLRQEMCSQEVLAAVLQPVLFIVQESTVEEYETFILHNFRQIFAAPKTVQAAVTILESLHIILEKTPREEIKSEVLPMLYNAFDSPTIQVQNAALIAVINISDYLDESAIKMIILPKTKVIYQNNQNDLKLVSNVLSCIERSLDRLDKSQIIDEIMPLLLEIRLNDPMVILRVVNIYRLMLSDKKYGLSVSLMATKVMPHLIPQTVNPSLNLEQFTVLIEVLQDMLDQIDRNQRNKLKLDNLSLPSPERHRPLRHQYSSDNMHVPPFNIPNLRIEQRKTSSAEDMQRKNSTGGILSGSWWFGAPSSPDSNFLRVANAFPNRRLSDNTLMTPKIRIAPSCASSPGGTPGGGLPIRRHSSIGPQERRGSTVNLSPPTGLSNGYVPGRGSHGSLMYQRKHSGGAFGYSSVSREGSSLSVPSTSHLARNMIGGSMPNTSSSVPFLLSSSMQSIRSRRPSAALGGSQGGSSGLLQQLGSGMYQFFGGRQ
ncbi:SCY1-like protein 2 isoform X2 [Euwallacea fornicatus]|uniref:SCY1-like protein 2 isoform X2 n=1 Tax=Euwallacea fornicatus TaxID=995702 RepID=UPI00338D5275